VNSDGGIGQHSISHRRACAQLMTANNQMNMTAIFCEINSLLTGGVPPTHDGKLFLSKLRGGSITDGTGADALAPEFFFLGEVQAVGAGPGGQDQGLGTDGFPIGCLDGEGMGGEIDAHRISLHQLGAPSKGLGPAAVHEFWTKNPVRKPWVVFNVGGGHQLAAWDAASLKARDQQGREVGACRIDRCGIAGRPRPNDHKILKGVGGACRVFCLERGCALGAHWANTERLRVKPRHH
jgi:hypothetical protein